MTKIYIEKQNKVLQITYSLGVKEWFKLLFTRKFKITVTGYTSGSQKSKKKGALYD